MANAVQTNQQDQISASIVPRWWRDRVVILCALLIVAGFVARLMLSWYSLGTNDAVTWLKFARSIDERGLVETYWRFPSLNHPPLPAWWAAGALRVSRATDVGFEFIFKLPAILADAGSCALLALIWHRRRGARWGWFAAVLMAWNPCAILVSGYHCNSDSIYACLCLLACLLADRRSLFAAGLALSLAINVKLIPVLLIPALLSLCRDRRDVTRFSAALCMGAIPFIPVFVEAGAQFARNALAYKSEANRWGVGFALYELHQYPPTEHLALDAMRFYHTNGRWFILAAVALLSFFSWRRRAWDPYHLSALIFAIFLVLAPGFGVQYTVILAPLLLAVGLTVGFIYGLLAGVFLLLIYWSNWTGTIPMFSLFDGPFPTPGAIVGVVVWLMLLWFCLQVLVMPRKRQ